MDIPTIIGFGFCAFICILLTTAIAALKSQGNHLEDENSRMRAILAKDIDTNADSAKRLDHFISRFEERVKLLENLIQVQRSKNLDYESAGKINKEYIDDINDRISRACKELLDI